jgi:aspartate kinase
MPIVVQKYGGTSVGSPERIGFVADRIVQARNEGNDVVAVVSAMGETTDELLQMAAEITPSPEPRELDMLLTSGERIAMSLLAIAVNARGCRAASYTGSQAGIITDTRHGQAKIVEIRPGRIKESLDAGNVVILAGFQGLSTDFDITTLGRGGSDTTAVAMAGALGAEACEIYTDVDGVYAADPRLFPRARKIERIPYEEMLELAAGGARVLGLRSVEYARKHGIRLHVRSSFGDQPGTWVAGDDGHDDEGGMDGLPMLESALIRGVALDDQEAKVTLDEVPDRPGIAAAIFKAIAAEGIHVDMIVQNVSHEGRTDLSFTLPRADLPRVDAVLSGIVTDVGAVRYETDDGIAKLSLVGAGIKSNPGVAAEMFDALAAEGVNIEMISTSSIRISCVIRTEDAERAMRAIVRRFELESEPLVEEA